MELTTADEQNFRAISPILEVPAFLQLHHVDLQLELRNLNHQVIVELC